MAGVKLRSFYFLTRGIEQLASRHWPCWVALRAGKGRCRALPRTADTRLELPNRRQIQPSFCFDSTNHLHVDPHPLLAQVPLTVSPFLSLPTATPLPYSYKQLPSTLPPSILSSPPTASNQSMDPGSQQQAQQLPPPPAQPAYVVSASGTSAHPDAILSSCLALQSHLQQLESSANATLKKWEDRRRAADLAEKRRVAPGWLDGDVKLLKPENVVEEEQTQMESGRPPLEQRHSVGIKGLVERRDGVPDPREGEELDRVFGGLDIK